MLKGKGFFVWQVVKLLENMGTQDVGVAARRAKAAGIEHVVVKIADGTKPFPLPEQNNNGRSESLTSAFINACRQEGIDVWGWAFVYGSGVDIPAQAEAFTRRAEQFGMNHIVVNAEDYGNYKWSSQAGATRARQYMTHLRQKMEAAFAHRMVEAVSPPPSEIVIGFTSYRFMSVHPSFPFDEFMAGCDIAMPQVYWVQKNGDGDAVRNLRQSYDEYKARYPRKLFVPLGAAYGEWYGVGADRYFWSASPTQITHFMEQAWALNLPAVSFWSWQHAFNDGQNQRYNGTQLWDAIAAYPYKPKTVNGETIEIGVNDAHYKDGLYGGNAQATLTSFTWQGRALRFAPTAVHQSGAWAQWQPDITQSGMYEISVWVPGRNATTRRAHYEIHGVVGAFRPVTVQVNQNDFYDVWVSLGVYELDANNPMSGQVTTTNVTGETDRLIAFSGVRWGAGTAVSNDIPLSDGFDAPIGTPEERRTAEIWPGHWIDANPFGNVYTVYNVDNVRNTAIHTGADLNLNHPHHDADRGKPIYAVASGVVTFAGHKPVWGKIVIIRHDPRQIGGSYVYSRSAHLGEMHVQEGQRVQRGQQIGTVGRELPHNPHYHLHFDISPTEVLYHRPEHWPGMNRAMFETNYIDPRAFIRANRP